MHEFDFETTLFIFRRDLRLEDNTALLFALQKSKEVLPCFIFTPEQIEENSYRGDACLQFLIESLEDLERQLHEKKGHLYLFFGKPEEIIKKLHVDAVVVNRDYTPYSIERDKKIEAMCRHKKISFFSFDDALLNPPETTLKADGKPYTVFTPYFRNASDLPVATPLPNRHTHYSHAKIAFAEDKTIYKQILPKRNPQAEGGREQALKILSHLKPFSHYTTLRNFPSEAGTTRLSAHLKFNTCSIREAYWAIHKQLGGHSDLLRSLYWRDFFSTIAFHFPRVFKTSFLEKFEDLEWENNKKYFHLWCEGKTGFPIVDAGMREMNQTGYMHNRVRMITASFLVKDLHINWRWGEKYFAQRLIDYDPAVNNGNWQWCASTGCDAQPYFRIFNPWNQQLKFDPDCIYIKQWIPELKKVSSESIHKWYAEENQTGLYPAPIIDHSVESKRALALYKKGTE